MSNQYPGGLITKTPVVPTSLVASGIWTLSQQAAAQATNTWPFRRDAQFPYVTMLLHGDGTNAAQNNTFLDSSTNAFSITRNGNTTQGSFSPYGSNWSNYFDGASYIDAGSNAAFSMGSGNYTLECWVYVTSASGQKNLFCCDTSGSGNIDWYIDYGTSNTKLEVRGGANICTFSYTPTANTWTHLALVRSGTGSSQTVMYANGVSVGSATDATNWTGTGPMRIGAIAGAAYMTGYISNARIVKATAVYSGTFTPSTTPLTAITNTSLLTCQNNCFSDSSANAFAITTSGSPSVQRFSPFSPTTAYSTSVIGGSGYFDGTGDYLTAPSNSAFAFGTGDFTVECWAYFTSVASFPTLTDSRITTASTAGFNLGLSTAKVQIYTTSQVLIGSTTLVANTWYHIAVTRSGTTLKIWLNGAQDATVSNSTNWSDTTLVVGATPSGVNAMTGYMTDTRLVKGTAVYTAAFTPPTAPLTAVTNTSLLLNYTNAGIFDNAMMNNLETVGNAQISTSVVKYGSGSMYFDGNGDNLSNPTTPDLNMGTGNWTIECWVYILSRTLNYPLIFGNNNGSYTTGALALVNSNVDLSAYNDRFCLSVKDHLNAPTLVASSTNSSNTWYHLAVVRNGTSLVMYRDGTSVASATISSGLGFDWGKLGSRIGGGNWDGAQSYFNGYIDDLRITKVARYTATFTVPDQAFPNG